MYNKKYMLTKIEEFRHHNPIYDDMEGAVCYLAYLNVGERGWFLCEEASWFGKVHKIHTSTIQNVEYTDDKIVVKTRNTKLTFITIYGD